MQPEKYTYQIIHYVYFGHSTGGRIFPKTNRIFSSYSVAPFDFYSGCLSSDRQDHYFLKDTFERTVLT